MECPNCKKKLEKNQKFCVNCGLNIEETLQNNNFFTSKDEPTEKKSS